MTNFERWKEGLKPEDLLRDDGKSCYNQSIFESCAVCPAHKFCNEWYEKFSDVADMAGLGSCENLFNEWAKRESEDTKYIVRCELDVGACMFSSFWNGRRFIREGEGNAKVFDRRESAEEEMNRFGYSPRDYSILETTEL